MAKEKDRDRTPRRRPKDKEGAAECIEVADSPVAVAVAAAAAAAATGGGGVVVIIIHNNHAVDNIKAATATTKSGASTSTIASATTTTTATSMTTTTTTRAPRHDRNYEQRPRGAHTWALPTHTNTRLRLARVLATV